MLQSIATGVAPVESQILGSASAIMAGTGTIAIAAKLVTLGKIAYRATQSNIAPTEEHVTLSQEGAFANPAIWASIVQNVQQVGSNPTAIPVTLKPGTTRLLVQSVLTLHLQVDCPALSEFQK